MILVTHRHNVLDNTVSFRSPVRQSNLDRMIRLADEFFAAMNDPDQISLTEEIMERLRRLHPATLSEERTEGGPVDWVLLIPTPKKLMRLFLAKQIPERDLLGETPPHEMYDCIWLSSGLVLPEYRQQGTATRLALAAIGSVRKGAVWL